MILGLISWQNSLNRSGDGRGVQEGNFGEMNGKPVTQTEYNNAYHEVILQYFLNNGLEWPKAGFNSEQETYKWIFIVRSLEKYNVNVDDASVARVANNILGGLGYQLRANRPLTYTEFVVNVLRGNASGEDFQRYLRHFLGLQQLMNVIGAGGKLVTPQEVQSLYEREHQDFSTEAVFFSASNYLASVPAPSADILGQFYTNHAAEYREPDRVQVSYVQFNITNYLSAAEQKLTNLTQIVDANMSRLGTNYQRLGKTPDEAKAKIREEIIREQALTNAYTDAIAFQNQLLSKDSPRVDDLAALAKDKNLSLKVTAPFSSDEEPKGIDVGPGLGRLATRLTPEEPFADRPLKGEDGVYIIALNKTIPSRIPSLNEIHSRVVADYELVTAAQMARENGQKFAQTLTNAMATGKTFAGICTESKVRPVMLPPFSLSTQELPQVESHVRLDMFKQIVYMTPVSKASGFFPTQDGGIIVYVREKLPIDQAKMKADLPAFTNRIRQQREQEAFNVWFSKEGSSAFRTLPAFQQKPSTIQSRS